MKFITTKLKYQSGIKGQPKRTITFIKGYSFPLELKQFGYNKKIDRITSADSQCDIPMWRWQVVGRTDHYDIFEDEYNRRWFVERYY